MVVIKGWSLNQVGRYAGFDSTSQKLTALNSLPWSSTKTFSLLLNYQEAFFSDTTDNEKLLKGMDRGSTICSL